MKSIHFRWQADEKFEPLPHFWEHCVGSGHATLALRADWQRQLLRCRRELGFRHVRFHGILSDDMGTLVREKDELVDSFYNTEQIFDFLLSIGMRPFVELSFMPSALAAGEEKVFHYQGVITPPKDLGVWADFIERLVSHWQKRYGKEEVEQWFFEVWNEPNLKAFWTGTQKAYFHFYQKTAEAVRRVNPRLKVGGPATAKNEWVAEFLAYCSAVQAPVDFISTHHYPTDAFGKPGDDTITQLEKSERSVLRKQAQEAHSECKGLPLYYTEWSTSSNPFDDLHDQPYAAAFIVKTVMEARGLVHAYSYWTFSDIFEENYFSSKPFHGGFGLLTVDGIPKPSFRAYEFLHRLGDEVHPITHSSGKVDGWLTKRGKTVIVLLTQSVRPRHQAKTENIHIELGGFEIHSAFLERIDQEHSNSRQAWQDMGSPSRLSPSQVRALEIASAPIRQPCPWRGAGHFEITLPPEGVALLTIETS